MFDIDAVITWVDGDDPALRAKREHHLAHATAPLHGNGTNPHRWICSDELNFCLRSIANNAPWVRRVWIVTDNQIPQYAPLPPAFAAKIAVVDHREIFAGYEDALPTFNSLSIETMLWRIPGLADHFLYFNDDVFLTAPVEPADFFDGDAAVLRGGWADYSHLEVSDESRSDPSLLNHYNQINAAAMIGYSADQVFSSAHVVHPMLRRVMARLFDSYRAEFIRNAGHRFRDTQQFLAQALHNHACLSAGNAAILGMRDYLHVAVGAFNSWTAEDVNAYLAGAERRNIKFLCINDLPEVERNFPDARARIVEAIGG
ncbi:stealth family protein [Sphingorhabdus arenilitoris]|uniref:Stealth family protein n=1 Tax=Sphingorhabdus arenilitoris TaxID=1490041 RepID=A0ABV8RIG3_9SPHN